MILTLPHGGVLPNSAAPSGGDSHSACDREVLIRRAHAGARSKVSRSPCGAEMKILAFLTDPQTSGGLLVALPGDAVDAFVGRCAGAVVIGEVTAGTTLRVIR